MPNVAIQAAAMAEPVYFWQVKKTVVIGASPNPERYSHLAVLRLVAAGHPVVPLGLRPGSIAGVPILTDRPVISDVDTVTLYLNSKNQVSWYPYILALNPRRILFNPGAENQELRQLASEKKIVTEEACTLVLLSTGAF